VKNVDNYLRLSAFSFLNGNPLVLCYDISNLLDIGLICTLSAPV